MSNETSARVEGESGARIFLDCDGVLADFDSYAEKIFGLPPRKAEEKLGAKRFWCDLQSHDGFYRNLPLMPDAQELFDAVAHLNPIILTGLPLGDWAEPQKREWGAKHFPHTTMICCMSADKRNHMKPGDILIDDFLKYKSLWVEAGGIFIHHTSTRASLAELKKLGILPEAKLEPLPNTRQEDLVDKWMRIASQKAVELDAAIEVIKDAEDEIFGGHSDDALEKLRRFLGVTDSISDSAECPSCPDCGSLIRHTLDCLDPWHDAAPKVVDSKEEHTTTGYWKHLPSQPMGDWHGSCSCGCTWVTNERVDGCPKETR